MNLQTSYQPTNPTFGSLMNPPSGGLDFDSVVLRPLTTHSEIEAVLHLRDEIDLSAHHGAGNFLSLEKKETNWALCALLNSMGTS